MPAPGVLVNDGDAESSELTAHLAASPAHGSVDLSADGSYIYEPDAGFGGVDSFAYTASDGQTSSPPATVTVAVDDTDTDFDMLPDAWEQQIVDHDPDDGVDAVGDVRPGGDFDADGLDHFREYVFCLDPTSALEPNWMTGAPVSGGGEDVQVVVSVHVRSDDPNLHYALYTRSHLMQGAWTEGALTFDGGAWTADPPDATVAAQTEASPGVWSVTIRLPAPAEAGYLRVGVR
jgi:VCBS repeat-containing protein